MTIASYAVAADTYIPMLESLLGILSKAEAFETDTKVDLAQLAQNRCSHVIGSMP